MIMIKLGLELDQSLKMALLCYDFSFSILKSHSPAVVVLKNAGKKQLYTSKQSSYCLGSCKCVTSV